MEHNSPDSKKPWLIVGLAITIVILFSMVAGGSIVACYMLGWPDFIFSPAIKAHTEYAAKARLPDDMRATAETAATHFQKREFDQAAQCYQTIIDKYPDSLYAWSNLGVIRFTQGRYDDALSALQKSVELSPNDAFSNSNLGITYYQLNHYDKAIDALQKAVELDPNDSRSHNYLGCCFSQMGDPKKAGTEFKKALELQPNFGDADFNLALVYATEKPPEIDKARQYYQKARDLGIEKDPRLERLLVTQDTPK